MSGGLAAATSHRRYGATDAAPEVAFAGLSNEEIEGVCNTIAMNIHSLNNLIRKIERDVDNVGTPRDNQNLRTTIKATQVKCTQLFSATLEELAKISGRNRVSEKKTRLRVERLENEMETAVVAYSRVEKRIGDKFKRYALAAPVSPSEEDSDQFHLREQEAAYNQQQRQLQMELEFEGGMLADRLALIKNVETDIIDGNAIMKMLSNIVHQQREVVDTIEQNTENTLANVESATEQLTKAASYVGRRRKTVFCIALAAIVVAVILLIVLLTK